MTGSISLSTEGVTESTAEAVAERLGPAFAALHASLAAITERLDVPPTLTTEEVEAVLTGSLLPAAAARLAADLTERGFRLVRLPEPTEPLPTEPDAGEQLTHEERSRRWFGRTEH